MSNFRYTRPDAFPPVVKNLIIINVLFFVATEIIRLEVNTEKFPGFPLTLFFALWPVTSDYFAPYQIFTHMFTHGGFLHILFNMFNLWTFGRVLESFWGHKKFLLFYFICGISAAAAHLIVQYLAGDQIPAVGASGAVMGVMVGFAYLFPNTELMLFGGIPIKAKWLIIAMIAYDLFGGMGRLGNTGIAHWAHLGGGLAGFILVFIWNKTNRRTFY
jgi:membrane associated rhomboid family serine protease